MWLLVAIAAGAVRAVGQPVIAAGQPDAAELQSRNKISELKATLAAAERRATQLEVDVRHLKAEERLLGSLNETAVSGAACHMDGHDVHPHVALIFLFIAVFVGTLLTQVKTLPLFSFLQETVVLFVLGLFFAIAMETIGEEKTSVLGESFGMWMRIDPHLLLYTMLPVLLTGDAMSIDTNIARGVGNQCIYLAGPGVLVNSFLIAIFLWLYLGSIYAGWLDFKLCLVQGSILAATDPVAVVSLLKELGAPPALTVQIAGESLLNDGTAIVLYTIAYDMLKGIKFDVAEIVIFLVKTVLCACGLGYMLGNIVVAWIRVAGERISHDASKIQISLTLVCAYVSFLLAEGVLGISGVLCTVAASLVLADKMWPAITSREAIEHVWHMFEYVGNTVIFFLAGALTGHTIMSTDVIRAMDYVHLLVLYLVMMAVRGATLYTSLPMLRRLAPAERSKVSVADATVMTWGGLRGAVGLALAIQVSMEAADIEALTIKDGKRVLFYTCGIAAMTLIINATSCPILVRWLEVGRTSGVKSRLIMTIYAHLHEIAENHPKRSTVTRVLKDILMDVQATIEDSMQDRLRPGADGENMVIVHNKNGNDHEPRRSSRSSSSKLVMSLDELQPISRVASNAHAGRGTPVRTTLILSGQTLLEKVDARKRAVEDIPAHLYNLLFSMYSGFKLQQELPRMPLEDEIREAAGKTTLSQTMLRLVHEIFLSLLRAQYQAQIDSKNFSAGSSQVDVLLSSVEHAYTDAWYILSDFREVKARLKLGELVEEEDEDDEDDGAAVPERVGRSSEVSNNTRANTWRSSFQSNGDGDAGDDRCQSMFGNNRSSTISAVEAPKEPMPVHPGTPDHETTKLRTDEKLEPDEKEEPELTAGDKTRQTTDESQEIAEKVFIKPALRTQETKGSSLRAKRRTIAVRRSSAIARDGPDFALNVRFRHSMAEFDEERGCIHKVVDSRIFAVTIVAALLMNAALIGIEQATRRNNADERLWFGLDLCFMAVFFLEFVLKFAALKCAYFADHWNNFDFSLLVFGMVGLVVDGMVFGETVDNEGDISSEARLIRLLKVLRALRILRVFRLIHFYHLLKAAVARRNLSVQLAENMQTLTVLTAFTSAHTRSQEELIHFFNRGHNERVAPEVARCVLESQMSLYEAILFSAEELKDVDKTIINAMGVLRDCNAAMDTMAHFVHESTSKGILTEQEAKIVLHPLQDRMDQFRAELRACELGLLREDSNADLSESPGSHSNGFARSLSVLRRAKSMTKENTGSGSSSPSNTGLVKQAWRRSMAVGSGSDSNLSSQNSGKLKKKNTGSSMASIKESVWSGSDYSDSPTAKGSSAKVKPKPEDKTDKTANGASLRAAGASSERRTSEAEGYELGEDSLGMAGFKDMRPGSPMSEEGFDPSW